MESHQRIEQLARLNLENYLRACNCQSEEEIAEAMLFLIEATARGLRLTAGPDHAMTAMRSVLGAMDRPEDETTPKGE